MPGSRIGIFGGTFNPIHNGHLHAARVVQKNVGFEKILFIPSFIPPHKAGKNIVNPQHRFRMVQMAAAVHPSFEASSLEIDEEGTSYSIHTLTAIQRLYPASQIYFLLGIDAFQEIKTWKDYREVLDLCSFVVMSRPGYKLEAARSVLGTDYSARMKLFSGKSFLSGSQTSGPLILLFPISAMNVSSTLVRQRLSRRESIRGLVPEWIETYIHKNHLYQGE